MNCNIDIIIPVYNRADIVGRTLSSIAAQTMQPAKVILVDNASTDSTVEVLSRWQLEMKSHGLEVEILSEPTPGATAARNRGLEASAAKYVMFFDSDDEMLPNHVEDFTKALAAHPEADIAGRSVEQHLLDGTVHIGKFTKASPLFFNIFCGILATQRYVVRRTLVKEVGGWDVTVGGWNDIELGQRLLLLKPKILVINGKPSVIIHSQVESITGQAFSHAPYKWESSLAALRRSAIEASDNLLLDWIDAKAMILAANYYLEGAIEEANRLYASVMATTRHPRRQKMIFNHQKRFGRYAWVLARVLFPF
ncbi:MAG: glycosyltransferase family 2 protein [Lachnoclostridium sp.]|nr:glycosyltransferase family 2 protein [Lachnoclostridium sp.]